MGLIGNLFVRLGVNTTQFTSGLSSAAASANTFSRNIANSFNSTANASTLAGNAVSVFSNKTSSGFKDAARIAQGIVISQLFYQTVNSIKEAASALGEFSMQCEDARMSFGILMKDQDKADRFMHTIQDFASKTPFTVQQSVEQARKLLAYGFSPSNMNPIMSTLADASSASGDSQTFERVGRALGQIRTKGKLASQELLQLTEAGIPAFEILREKLHLTQEEMGKIGKLGITGDVAVNALLKGMQERYGGAASALAETTHGMLSTIKDDMLIVGSELTSPMYEGFKVTIRKIRNELDKLKNIVRDSGTGGLMRSIIPTDIFPKIQILVANLIDMKQNFLLLIRALAPFGSAIMEFVVNALNLALPVINAFNRILYTLIYIAGQCSPFVRNLVGAIMGLLVVSLVIQVLANFIGVLKGLFVVRLIAQLIIGLAQAIRILSLAMISSPLMAFLGLATGALLYFGMTSGKVSGWINSIGGGITKAFGTDPSTIFVPKMKQNNDIAGEFNKNLTLSKDKLDNMGKAAKKAGDKAKDMLMSFDEVFNIKNPDETGDTPDAGEIGDIGDIGAVPEIPSVAVPDVEYPDPTSGIMDWINNFIEQFKKIAQRVITAAALGTVIGGLLGFALFGPGGIIPGMGIGGGVSAIVAYFWDSLSNEFKNAIKGAGIGAIICGALGLIFAGVPGMLAGIGIGGSIGAIVGYYWDSLTLEFKESIQGAAVGAAIIGALGLIFFGIPGMVIGMGLGGSIGAIVGYYWESLAEYFGKQVDTFMATAQLVWDDVYDTFKKAFGEDKNWAEIGGYVLFGILEGMFAAVVTGLEGLWDFVVKPIIDGICKLFGIHSPATTMYPVGGYLIAGIWEGIKGAISGFYDDIKSLGSGVFNSFNTWLTNIHKGIDDWTKNTLDSFGGWWKSNKDGFDTWCTEVNDGISTWATNAYNNIGTWVTNTSNKFNDWQTTTKNNFNTWFTDTKQSFSTWCTNVLGSINSWYTSTSDKVNTWVTNTKSSFDGWWSSTKTGFSTWWIGTKGSVDSWYTDTYGKISSWVKDSYDSISGWWTDTTKGFSDWAKDCFDGIADWFGKITTKIGSVINKIKDLSKLKVSSNIETSYSDSDDEDEDDDSLRGHATGGIFNREHIARFAEGNKAEAIVPLQNDNAMQPFVDAVAAGLEQSLGGMLSASMNTGNQNSTDNRQIMYVGTLIADESGLKELDRRMRVITLQEDQRRGITNG